MIYFSNRVLIYVLISPFSQFELTAFLVIVRSVFSFGGGGRKLQNLFPFPKFTASSRVSLFFKYGLKIKRCSFILGGLICMYVLNCLLVISD